MTTNSKSTTPQEEPQDTPPWAWIKAVNEVLIEPPYEEPELPVQVLPWLFLAGLPALSNKQALMELGVTHVLSTNKIKSGQELENLKSSLNKCGIQHCAVEGLDEPAYDMMQHWEASRAFLQQARQDDNHKVVVHCAAGQNRSGLMVAAVLVEMERMNLMDAVKLLKAKRGIVLTNLSFQKQLCLLAAKEGLLGDQPAGITDDAVPEENYAPWVRPIDDDMTDSSTPNVHIAAAMTSNNNETTPPEEELKDTTPWAWIKAVNDVLTDPPYEEPDLPVGVLPWLFLSGLPDLHDKQALMELGVTHVLTTNKMYSSDELEKLKSSLNKCGIQHCTVEGLDHPDYDMIQQHWEASRDFLQQVRQNDKHKVVVHCAAGQNRSGLIVGAALIEMERMNLMDAVRLLKEKRGMVLINRSFQKQLCLLAAKEGLLGDQPVGFTNDAITDSSKPYAVFGGYV